MKYLTTLFVSMILHIDAGRNLSTAELHKINISELFAIYGIGFASVQLVFAARPRLPNAQ